jgi:beta-glucanase (GH16 family)
MIFMRSVKATEVIEKERLQRWNDYQTYQEVEKSDKLKTYLALKEKVESIPFQEKKKEIEYLRFSGSPEAKMFREYSRHKRNKRLNTYFEVHESNDLERFNQIEKSGQQYQLNELKQFVKSGQYKKALQAFNKAEKNGGEQQGLWENSEAYAKKLAFDELCSSPDLAFVNRYKKLKAYKNYLRIKGSALLNHFEDLKTEIESDKFKERKAYLEDEKRYEKTDDYQTLTQFQELDHDAGIQLYLKFNDTDAFKFFREWTTAFEDDFNTMDKSKWSFTLPLAKNGPGRNFSLKNQLHYANNSDNFDVENSILTLETKRENVDGLYWDEKFGFIQRTFNYASGIIHTLPSFTQEYGHFEIKVKASKVKGVISSVSLVDADEEICIRLLEFNGSAALGGLITTDHHKKNFEKVKLSFPSKGYLLIALKWTPEKLEWYVNDRLFGAITGNVPHVPLGLRIETEVLKETGNLPHRLDVDWIKCYKKNS